GLVFALERNAVLDLGPHKFIRSGIVSGQGQSDQWAQRILAPDPITGQTYPLGTFYGPVFVDINPANGFQRFVCSSATAGCVNGLTTTRGLPDAADYQVIGNANPDFTIGMHNQVNLGKFDISFLLRASVGQDVFNNTALVWSTKSNALQDKNFLAPALTDGTDLHEPAIFSSRWVERASFLRLQNLTVEYALDLPVLTRSARSARLYVSADNLFVITGYSGLDPEVSSVNASDVKDVGLAARAALAGVYAGLRNTAGEGEYWGVSEVSTDEIVVPTRGSDWFDNGTWLETHRQTWSANSPGTLSFLNNAWNTSYAGIARANVLLDALTKVTVPNQPRIEGEARFLRAFYYYLLMDLFGGVRIATSI